MSTKLSNVKPIRKVYRYGSASNPGKTYETILYLDGSTSCNCPSWTKRAVRQCKHTLDLESKFGGRVEPPPAPLTKEREQRIIAVRNKPAVDTQKSGRKFRLED